MKCTIFRWLLGIWLVETVSARHILNGEEVPSSTVGRSGRDQFHRQPFYGQSPHLSYSSFRSSMRRTPPQSPHRRNLVEQDTSSNNGQNEEYATNYFFTNGQPIQPYNKNQQNLNVYSAVRLHGALEARAKAEPGSPTILQNYHYSNFNHPPQFNRVKPERHWRRDNEPIDGESDEGGDADDLARFSLYNSYFDNEHSIKALNSMKCVTPTGSPGFCSTFRGCVPSFFTTEGELEAPALAELISTSIGYCTTNVSHHFIREQRQQPFSREERRFNSVANRIICCPGIAPIRDPNQDPDKIFIDYLEAQRNKLKTTTTTTTVAPSTSELPPAGDEGAPQQESEAQHPSQIDDGVVNDGQGDGQDESQNGSLPVEAQQPVETSTSQVPPQQSSSDDHVPSSDSQTPEIVPPAEDVTKQQDGQVPSVPQMPGSSSAVSEGQGQASASNSESSSQSPSGSVGEDISPPANMQNPGMTYPEGSQNMQNPGMTYPEGSSSQAPEMTYPEGSSSQTPEMTYPEGSSSQAPEMTYPEGSSSQAPEMTYPEGSSSQAPEMTYPEGSSSQAPEMTYPEGSSPQAPEMTYPEGSSSQAPDMTYPEGSSSQAPGMTYPEGSQNMQNPEMTYPEGSSDLQSPGMTYPSGSSTPGMVYPIETSSQSSVSNTELPSLNDSPANPSEESQTSGAPSSQTERQPVGESSSGTSNAQGPISESPNAPGAVEQATEGALQDEPKVPASEISNPQDSASSSSSPDGSAVPMPMYPNTDSPVSPSSDDTAVPSTEASNVPISSGASEVKPEDYVSASPEQKPSGGSQPSSSPPPSSMYPSESESQPSMDEGEQPQQSAGESAPPSSSIVPQEPAAQEQLPSSSDASTSTPGNQEPQSPGKSTDSPIIKIKPDPVSGVNGKFTLPGGLYIVSSSTDHPQSNQNKVHPYPGGAGTIIGSQPIIIVTSPGGIMDMRPHFPSDFPSLGQDPAPPIDDSSVELQKNRPTLPPSPMPEYTSTSTSPSQSSALPEATSENIIAIAQDKVEVTTMVYPASSSSSSSSSSDHSQQDESSRVITTPQPISQDDASASGDVSTSKPLNDGEDDEENDALTITPTNPSPTAKAGPPSTTEVPSVSVSGGDNIAVTTIRSVGQAGSELDITTIPSVQSVVVGSQEIGITTIKPSVAAVAVAGAGSSQENIETTANYIAASTVPTEESEESDESSEEVRATPSDDQKTTVSPVKLDESENDVVARTTTMPPSVPVNNDENEISQEDEPPAAPTTPPASPPSSSGAQQEVGDIAMQTMKPMTNLESMPVKIQLNPGSESASSSGSADSQGSEPVSQQDQPEPGSNYQTTEPQQPFPGSSPEGAGESPQHHQQQPFPGSEQQPFPDPAPTTVSSSIIANDDQQSVGESGSEGQVSGSETSSSTQVSSDPNIGDATRPPTTGSPVDSVVQHDPSESDSSSNAVSSGSQQPGNNNGEAAPSNDEPATAAGNESSTSSSQPSSVSGSQSSGTSGSESATEGSLASDTGSESTVSGNESGSTPEPIISSSISPGSESLVSIPAGSGGDSSVPTESSSSPSEEGENSLPASEVSNADSSSTSTSESPEAIPSNDEPASVPSNPESDSNVPTSQSPISPSSTAVPTTTSGGGASETESIPQENVPQVPSESPENASPVQGSSPQEDSPVSSDSMQDPQPIIATSEAPQNVSSSNAPVESGDNNSEGMYTSTTAASLEPVVPPEDLLPNYQILKACKFQSFFRSINDMNYSYRHYPWLATIVGGTRPFSSGTLITDRHILTASHFLSNITVSDVFNMRIHIGYRTSYSGQTEGPYAVRKVRKVIRHKGFSFERLYNDIAVLVLDRPVRFSEDIYPVCISSNSKAYADGTAEAFETGWIEDPRTYTISQHHNYIDPHIQKYFSFGYKNITWRLQEAPQRVRTNAECQSNYGFLEKNGIMVTDSMVCAGSGDTRSCPFRGNSGAPLFMRNENDKMTEQIGIVSWGIGCGHFPFVFTRVEAFLPWLDRVVYNSR